MKPEYLEQLQACCRDQAAFERMQQILVIAAEPPHVEQQKILFRVISKIRETLDLDTIFKTTAIEVRQLLNADRVGVFRFYPDSGWDDGEFVAESVVFGFHSALKAKIHDHCFGEQYAIHYQQGRIQAVSDIYTAGLRDCHVQVLRSFQIRANLVVPLLQDEDLWGLLCVHQCAEPRDWQPHEIEFVSQIATQLGVALQQAERLRTAQQQATELSQTLGQLQRSQTHLIQSEKMSSLGQLVAGVAHEINNPVNFIYGNLTHASQYAADLLELLSLYQQEHTNPSTALHNRATEVDLDFLMEDFPKILSSMQIGADRIRQIVLSLRNFSHLDEAAMKPVDLHEGIDSSLLILQHRLKPGTRSIGIKIEKQYGDLPLVECYASQINQVFMNLLSNAIDALEEMTTIAEDNSPDAVKLSTAANLRQPQITIRTFLIPDFEGGIPRAVVCIADNGSGISPAIQRKLFDPFFTTKPIGKGTGLGLSISHQIVVEQHRGALQCYSQPGENTEFWVEIPILQTGQGELESRVSGDGDRVSGGRG